MDLGLDLYLYPDLYLHLQLYLNLHLHLYLTPSLHGARCLGHTLPEALHCLTLLSRSPNAMALRPDLALSSEPFPEHDGTTRPDLADAIR